MDNRQTAELLAMISATYPNFKPANLKESIQAWTWALEDFDYSDIKLALKTYIRTSGNAFAPSTAELIAMIRKPAELTALSEGEAWALVKKALKNGIYGYEQEYGKLPPAVQKAVGGASLIREWAGIDSEDVDTVISSNFMRTYKTILKREAEREALPAELRARIEGNNTLAIEG